MGYRWPCCRFPPHPCHFWPLNTTPLTPNALVCVRPHSLVPACARQVCRDHSNAQLAQRHDQNTTSARIKHTSHQPHLAYGPATASLPREQPARAVGWLGWLAGHCTRVHVIQAAALGASRICGMRGSIPRAVSTRTSPLSAPMAHLHRPVHAQRPHSARACASDLL